MDSLTLDSILHHPAIWPKIAPEGIEPFSVEPRENWVCWWADGGVIIFHPFRDGMKIHPNFLPGFRGRNAYEAIRQSVESLHVPVYAEIDRESRHLRVTAMHLGFELIERNERDLFRREK